MTTIQLHGWDGNSDAGTLETRAATIDAQPDHILVHLHRSEDGPGDCSAVWVQWRPNVGREVIVHQDGDDSSVTLTIPDDGSPLVSESS